MTVRYLQLQPGSEPPEIPELRPFKCVIIVEEEVTDEWMWSVSTWLVESGCLWMNAWGEKCSKWDDSVDWANLEKFNWKPIPDGESVMTAWFATDPLSYVLWFTKTCSIHHKVDLQTALILHISSQNKETEILTEYAKA